MSPITRQSVFMHVYIIRHPAESHKYKAHVAELGSCMAFGKTETDAEARSIEIFRGLTNHYIKDGIDIPWRTRVPAIDGAIVRTVHLLLGPAPKARWYDPMLSGLLWLGGWCLVHGIHLIERIGGWIEDRIRGKKGK